MCRSNKLCVERRARLRERDRDRGVGKVEETEEGRAKSKSFALSGDVANLLAQLNC